MNHVTLTALCKHETDDAMLLEVDGDEQWVPTDQCTRIVRHGPCNPLGHQTVIVTMTEWIAEKKGFA